jgi:chromosome segregation ATPase
MNPKDTAVLGNFQINLPAPNGASVSISGYVYEAESLESLNDRMDTCREALLRQQAILELPELEKKIEMYATMLEQHQKAYAALLEKKRGKVKIASAEESQLTNLPTQIKQITSELEKGKAAIAKLKKAA